MKSIFIIKRTNIVILVIFMAASLCCTTPAMKKENTHPTGVIQETYDDGGNCEIVYQVWAKGLKQKVIAGAGVTPDKSKAGQSDTYFIKEGWVDDDTFRAIGIGMPKKHLANKVARKHSAKEAAILMARKKILETFKSASLQGASGASDSDLSGLAAAKEFSSLIKGKGGAQSSPTKNAKDSKKTENGSDSKEVKHINIPTHSGLKAGFADDNKQFNYFIDFLKKFEKVEHYPIQIQERIILKLKDRNGKSIPNAQISIMSGTKNLASGKTHSDGSFMFFPSEYANDLYYFAALVEYHQEEKRFKLDRQGKREIDLIWQTSRTLPPRIPFDMVFIFDTTGSMGEEIDRLKKTIEIIHLNLSLMKTKPLVRFGMVLYKDRRDEYLTKIIPLTSDINLFRKSLDEVSADGGGDKPEDLHAALQDSMTKILWNNDGIRLAYIITDAMPHLDYDQKEDYVWASRKAREKGIKLYSVACGGLDVQGEYIMRQISQYTGGKYIFLHRGEKGESQGGKPGSVSHHTGANYQTDKLESIIIRFGKEELQNLSDTKLEDDEKFVASKVTDEKKEETLVKLFAMTLKQLSDYSSINLQPGTLAAVLPISTIHKDLQASCEYFTEQIIFSLGQSKIFTIVERKDLQKVLKELALSQTGLTDETNAAKLGKFLGAKILIMGKLYKKGGAYELFLKLIRVETAEVLSVTKANIDPKLGL